MKEQEIKEQIEKIQYLKSELIKSYDLFEQHNLTSLQNAKLIVDRIILQNNCTYKDAPVSIAVMEEWQGELLDYFSEVFCFEYDDPSCVNSVYKKYDQLEMEIWYERLSYMTEALDIKI